MQVKYLSGNGSIPFEIGITPEIHKDGDWYVAFCPEVPGANGQGRTREESIESLKEGVVSIMQDRRADAAKPTQRVLCASEPV